MYVHECLIYKPLVKIQIVPVTGEQFPGLILKHGSQEISVTFNDEQALEIADKLTEFVERKRAKKKDQVAATA